MEKIAIVLIAFSFILTSCSIGSPMKDSNEIVEKKNKNYVDYTSEVVKNTQGDKVLFFHATWCGTCKSASKKIAEAETVSGLTIFKVDYDTNAELRKMYDVTSQHTFVQVDNDGTMLAKWSGSKNIEEIQSNLVQSTEKEKMMDNRETDFMINDSDKIEKEEISNSKEKIMSDTRAMMKQAGKFVTYSADGVANTPGNKVLFFHASWCPSCIAAAKNLSSETVPAGLNVFKVDYDNSVDLKEKYGVVSQHTFVEIDDNGTMVKRWFGSRNYEDILAQLQP